MKIYIALVLTILFLSACSAKEPSGAANAQAASGAQVTPAKVEASQSGAPATTAGAPVEFSYGGLTPDKENISYKIKVNTDKPIMEVHLALKESDAGGKVVEQTTVVWQNIVRSTQQPIERGKTYEAQTVLDPGATKAECLLKEVIFEDGTRWTAR
jgi:hypothetical protein